MLPALSQLAKRFISTASAIAGRKGDVNETEVARRRAAEADAILPIARRYCLVIGCYYVIVLLDRFRVESGLALAVLAGLSATGMGLSLWLYAVYLHPRAGSFVRAFRGSPSQRSTVACLAVNLVLTANPIAFQLLHYERERMLYFVFLAMVYAITGVRLRVVLPSVLATLAAMAAIAYEHRLEISQTSVAFAVLIIPVIIAIATGVRQILFQAVHARLGAETLYTEARTLADCDALTGLANRRSFFRAADAAVAGTQSGDTGFDLALIDLDGFKPINDIYGHSVGDDLLVEVASRLRQVCGRDGFPARMGGDEFAIVLHGDRSEAALQAFGNALCEALRETYLLGSVSANISASVGFVRCPAGEGAASVSHLLERADYALYFAKQNLRGAPIIFTEKHETEMRDFSLVDQTLRSSDLNRELSIVFQPQVDVVNNRAVSFEALARWNSARLGAVRPDIFIKAAERSGLITEITLLLLTKALNQVATWPEDMRVSFNLSARDLRSSISIANICNAVRASGVDPRRIEFEITETAMLTDFAQACDTLTVLKDLGCRVAIDDFGSGYSSFSYIHRLPVDKIKIDRSFVVQLVKHGTAIKIIKTIVDLCRNLGLDCVIEGVETQAEMSALSQIRARYIQGYLFARPMPAGEVLPYLANEKLRLEAAS